MESAIHYEEDLFFLNILIKGHREGLKLSLDSDLFVERVFDDIRFLGATLDSLFASLKESPHLIRRADYLYQLIRVETSFCELLNEALVHQAWAELLAPHRAELTRWKSEHQDDTAEIRSLLRVSGPEQELEEVITGDELALLIRPETAEETIE